MTKINLRLNSDNPALKGALQECCGASVWVKAMMEAFPFKNKDSIFEQSEKAFSRLSKEDWLEAFSHHPKIGDIESLREKFKSTAHLASSEQSGTEGASEETLVELSEFNRIYAEKFGFIFIICATGKTADEMLAALKTRVQNDSDAELKAAGAEQIQITRLRLEKLLSEKA